MQILMTIQSCKGFVVIVASTRNPVWTYHWVLTSISVLSLTELDIHSCRWIGLGDTCHSLHVATNFALAGSKAIAPSTHVEGCDQAIALKVKKRGFTKRPHAGTHDSGTGLKDLGKVVMLKAFVPMIHAVLTARMSRAQRFPPAGEDEEDNNLDDSKAKSRHPIENAVSLPTQQMLDYKKKLKEAGRKPEKKKKPSPEQHFDDCGEDLRSIFHFSLIPESLL